MLEDPRIARPLKLVRNTFHAPGGWKRKGVAFLIGLVCHLIFALSVLAMISAMFFGMSKSLGSVSWPLAIAVNGLLILQFPIMHSWLLTGKGGQLLARLVPGPYGKTLSTTTYAIIASVQLLLLFTFWTPSGIVWWQPDGWVFLLLCCAYACSWLLLAKASLDAGIEVQSGALGWLSMFANIRPVFPDMPTLGLFKHIRHPIYAAFVLTLWTVPTWTPDQLALAICLSTYCILAPILKERRFTERYGERFAKYRRKVPYMLPSMERSSARTQIKQPQRTTANE